MSRGGLYRVAGVFAVLALAAGIAGHARGNELGITGAYFNRSVEAPAYAGVLDQGFWLYRQHTLYGIAIGLAIAALVITTLALRAGRTSSP